MPRYSDEVNSSDACGAESSSNSATRSRTNALPGDRSALQQVGREGGVDPLGEIDAGRRAVRVRVALDLRPPVPRPVGRLVRIVDHTPVPVTDAQEQLLTEHGEVAGVGDARVA